MSSLILSFHDLMERYMREYLAFTQVILKQTNAQASFIEPASVFIMERHNRMPCISDNDYAAKEKGWRAKVLKRGSNGHHTSKTYNKRTD